MTLCTAGNQIIPLAECLCIIDAYRRWGDKVGDLSVDYCANCERGGKTTMEKEIPIRIQISVTVQQRPELIGRRKNQVQQCGCAHMLRNLEINNSEVKGCWRTPSQVKVPLAQSLTPRNTSCKKDDAANNGIVQELPGKHLGRGVQNSRTGGRLNAVFWGTFCWMWGPLLSGVIRGSIRGGRKFRQSPTESPNVRRGHHREA